MSLLARSRIPHQLALHRWQAASVTPFSSSAASSAKKLPTGPASNEAVKADPFSYSMFDQVSSAPPKDEGPPVAPSTAYGRARPTQPNPLREQRQRDATVRQSEVEGEKVELQPLPIYRMYVKATRNNCIITFTRPNGDVIRTHTGGSCGFKHVNRSSHEAAHQTVVRMFKTIEEVTLPQEPKMMLHVYFKDFGRGRDAVQKAFLSTEGDVIRPKVVKVSDNTPIKIGGNRAKKMRRV